jgi:hypothetical protein
VVLNPKRLLVAITPLAGALTLPLAVPLVIAPGGIPTAVTVAVVVSCLWFTLMLSSSEMPGHD